MIHEWNGINVTVMGLGLFGGGVGATRWLLKQGARVTVTDLKSSAELGPSVRELEGEDICWRLGEHRLEDFTEADAVVVSPAVPKSSGFLRAAYDAGRTVTSEMNLFLQRCPASVTGMVAGGANVVCFTTGRGSVYGCKPVPSLKLATNSR
ncbi:MAG: UxaA family hydrolase, partial [Planctomycetota bacterium]|nr:UxaA family hydrolase [Planctomycetota bacterium]